MSSFNLLLVLAVLACVWVFVSASDFSGNSSRKNLISLVAAFVIALLLAASNLGNEWIIRRVAGNGFTEPHQALQAAKAANGEAGAMGAYTAGTLETLFNRDRENAAALGLAAVLCLVSGLWLGRRRAQPPATGTATTSTVTRN